MKTQTTGKLTLKKETIRVLNTQGPEQRFAPTGICTITC